MIRELDRIEYEKILDLAKCIKANFTVDNLSANSSVIVYEMDDRIVGFLEYYANYETAELLNIAVDPKYRNNGIATKLIGYLTNLSDIERIMLEVSSGNKDALTLYSSLGFKTIRTIKNYYEGRDGYAMERSIK